MSIKKICENCALENIKEFCSCKYDIEYPVEENDMFMPKEQLIREDEKHKFITLLKSDLENYEGLASEAMQNNNMCDLIVNNAVRRYIEETIEVLKEK